MQCNGSPFNVDGAPKWWFVFEKTAKQELAVRPTTPVLFVMEFLSRAANKAGCPEVSEKRPRLVEVLAGFESCN